MADITKYYSLTDDLKQYGQVNGESNPNATTMQDMQAYMQQEGDTLENVVKSYLWQPETEYSAGQEVHSPNMPGGYMGVCETAGTTGTTEPDWSTTYSTFTDGTVTWKLVSLVVLSSQKVDKTTYAKEVGMVFAFAGETAPSGYLFCDGSELSKTDYATLYSVIGDAYNTESVASGNFCLPNLVDKFIQGNSTVGSVKSAGLPNITGQLYVGDGRSYLLSMSLFGAFAETQKSTTGVYTYSGTNANTVDGADFNASRSSSIYGNSTTVQPPAVTMQYIIRYE